jgi:hypothetical protein
MRNSRSKRKRTKAAPGLEGILEADIANLKRKVEAGHVLSKSERDALERSAPDQEICSTLFAKNQSELARVLGVSRQTIWYHVRQPSAPKPRLDGRHEVAAWRRYLIDNGRILAETPEPPQPRPGLFRAAATGAEIAFFELSETLPGFLKAAFEDTGLTPTQLQISNIAVKLWILQLARMECLCKAMGWEPIFDPDEPEADYPNAIRECATTTLLANLPEGPPR